ncbi:MAG: hypothetical protein COB99_04190 [Sulfurimonas sp.]|nr:MAG: hypothetical protein COB99_04190 [Sulfurimonas sp.]
MNKYIFYIVVFIIIFVFAFIAGNMNIENIAKDIKITDFVSSLIASLSFIIAVYSYDEWLNKKKKDDSYKVAKEYIFKCNT